MDNIVPIIRELNNPTSNISDAAVYRGLASVVERYNMLARSKGLPIKNIPVYNKHANTALMKRLISNILKDLDRIKDIKEEAQRKVLTGVIFDGNIFMEGIWIYTKDDDNNITVTLNAEEFSKEFSGSNIVLGYGYMPYEKLIDMEENEYITVSYAKMFMPTLPNTVTSLTIDNWTNTNVKNMNNMFRKCGYIQSLTLGNNFNASSVTDMGWIFAECSGLKLLTLGNKFNTSNVTNMTYMFHGCSALGSLTLGNSFNTASVTDMACMFQFCSSLTSLTLSDSFNTSSVTNMDYMFHDCSQLQLFAVIDTLNTSSVTTMRAIFQGCNALTEVTLGTNFNTSTVNNMIGMFTNCINLKSLTLSDKFVTSSVEDMTDMFNLCDKLASLTLYQSAQGIIVQLTGGTWKINDDASKKVKVTQGESVEWIPPELPNEWDADEQWTFSLNTQSS